METVGAARADFWLARTRVAQSGQGSVDQGQGLVRSEGKLIGEFPAIGLSSAWAAATFIRTRPQRSSRRIRTVRGEPRQPPVMHQPPIERGAEL